MLCAEDNLVDDLGMGTHDKFVYISICNKNGQVLPFFGDFLPRVIQPLQGWSISTFHNPRVSPGVMNVKVLRT